MDDRGMLFECNGCNRMNVFPEHMRDGATCMMCGAALVARNYVMVYRKSNKQTPLKDIIVNVKIDTTEIDKALEKMKELAKLAERGWVGNFPINKEVGSGSTKHNHGFVPESYEMLSGNVQKTLSNTTVNINTGAVTIEEIEKQLAKLQTRRNTCK